MLIIIFLLFLLFWIIRNNYIKLDIKKINKKNWDNNIKYRFLIDKGLKLAKKNLIPYAEKYFLAATEYNKEAYSYIGYLYLNMVNKQIGIKKYEEGYLHGDYKSGYYLGKYYDEIGELEKAKEWYLKVANTGYVLSQLNLGIIYEYEKDYDKAERWYLKAANKRNSDAMYGLGNINRKQKKHKIGIYTHMKMGILKLYMNLV